MPRDKGQEHILDAPYPITADEVRNMVSAVDKRGRLKSLTDSHYTDLATWLSGFTMRRLQQRTAEARNGAYTMTQADIRYRERWEEAARLLRRTREHPGSFVASWNVEKAAVLLEEALDHALTLLNPQLKPTYDPFPQRKQWAYWALPIAFTMSEIVKSSGGPGGTTRNTITVKFAAVALERIGWRDEHGRPITPAAIARYCESKPATSNDHNLS